MIEHEINEHTGHRNIKPDRHRPAAEAAMLVPAALKNRDEGNDYQRQGDESE